MQSEEEISVWYKNFWPWFIIALLLGAVIVSFTLLRYSIVYSDSLVVDNYYEAGKGINKSMARETYARELGLNAELRLKEKEGAAKIILEGNSRPQYIILNLISPTQPEKDMKIILQPSFDGSYRGVFTGEVPKGKRFIELLGTENGQDWRLYEEEFVETGTSIQLGQRETAKTDG